MHAKAERPTTLLLYGVEPLVAAGRGSLGDELIRYAGGRNVFADSAKAYITTDHEKIISLAPEVIVQVTMGTEPSEKARKYWSRWTSIPAVKNGRVHVLAPDLLTRPGPRIIKGLRLLEKAIHGKADGE
jgi:iron complex transport system substrate-binding protein